jgi:pimeloyl-ACP methyl ester carboxylesterase
MKQITGALLSLLVAVAACDRAPTRQPAPAVSGAAPSAAPRTGYAPIGPLKMYYEVHGTGRHVLLIHGGVSEIQTSFGSILPYLAKQRQVVAIEEQGHGHTADVDRPLTFEQMADDAAALLRHLRIENTDIVGYSDGGNVALALAMRHPAMVRKVVIASTNYNNDGLDPKVRQGMEQSAMKSESEVVKDIPPQFAKAYADGAPQPEKWPSLVSKVMKQGAAFKGWTPEQIRSITAPTLIVLADRDIVTPEHAVAMFRLHRIANLAIVPGRDHFSLVDRPDVLNPMLRDFLEAPMPTASSTK